MFAFSPSRRPTPLTAWAQLRAWYGTPLGQRLEACERRLIERALPDLFGYLLVQVGQPWSASLLQSSRVRDRLTFALPGDACPGPVTRPDALPIAGDSVDVVVLPHVLECAADPRAVLDEVHRVLIGDGCVVILGLNPLSPWGGRRLARDARRARFVSPFIVGSWLESRGFSRAMVSYGFHRPPLRRESLLERLQWMERWGERFWPMAGASYLIMARKRAIPMTLIRPRWDRKRRFAVQGQGVTGRMAS